MIENKLKFFFKNQIWHIGGLIVLYYVALQMIDFETDTNVFFGISSKNWFLFSIINFDIILIVKKISEKTISIRFYVLKNYCPIFYRRSRNWVETEDM